MNVECLCAFQIPVPVGADSRGPSFPQHEKIGTVRPHGWEKRAGLTKE